MKYLLAALVVVAVIIVVVILRALGNIHACARTGRVARLRKLLAGKPELINAGDGQGETPVHHAAKYGQVECLRVLLGHGANVNATSSQGVTPLHYAAALGEIDAVEYLLEQGAAVDPKEETGMTPIMAAQGGGHSEIVDILKRAGANADAVPAIGTLGGGHFLTSVQDGDPLMRIAVKRAREQIPTLLQLFKAHPRDTMVKFSVQTNSGQTEHVWGALLEINDETFKARVKTPPVTQVGDFDMVQRRPLSEMEDWQVEERDGRIRGGFGYQVMFYRTKEELGQLPKELARHEGRFADHDLEGLLREAKEEGN